MVNGNSKQIAAWIIIALTVITTFTTQVINADVRNRERDDCMKQEITDNRSEYRSEIREIKTRLEYIQSDNKELLGLVQAMAEKQGIK